MGGLFKDCGCGCNGEEQKKKFMASLMSGLLFFLIANPETFILVRRFIGGWVASPTGYPTILGLIFHAFVFMLIVWGMMSLKRENAKGAAEPPPAAVPEAEAKKDGVLPPPPEMEQPVAEVASSAPVTALLPPGKPEPTTSQGTMSKISNMLGGHDINSDPMMATAPAVYGSNWRQCACGDGTQVMILK